MEASVGVAEWCPAEYDSTGDVPSKARSRQRVSPEKRLFVTLVQARLCALRYKKLQRKKDIKSSVLWVKRGARPALLPSG